MTCSHCTHPMYAAIRCGSCGRWTDEKEGNIAEIRRYHKACQMALEALEHHTAIEHPQQAHYRDSAIEALREVLGEKE